MAETPAEFDPVFLKRNCALLKHLRLQQEHDDRLKEQKIKLFGTLESTNIFLGKEESAKIKEVEGRLLYETL